MAGASESKQSIGSLVKTFYDSHGVIGFLKQGLGAEMSRATFSRVIKFWLQPVAHIKVFGKKQNDGTPITKGIAGALATIPEVLTISPFENAKLASQLDREKRFTGTMSVLAHLYRTRGIGGFYIGYFGMQIRQVCWTGGFFFSVDLFRELSRNILQTHQNTALSDTMGGFMAGVFGTCLNCWADVVRTVTQKQTVAETFNPNIPRPNMFTPTYLASGVTGIFGKAVEIYQKRGFSGLYAGFAVKAIYLGGSGAILAVLVPRFKEMWGLDPNN